jgi:hypothetical protein
MWTVEDVLVVGPNTDLVVLALGHKREYLSYNVKG